MLLKYFANWKIAENLSTAKVIAEDDITKISRFEIMAKPGPQTYIVDDVNVIATELRADVVR